MSGRAVLLSAALASALAATASAQGMKLPEKPTLLPPCAPGAVPLADTAEFMVYVSVRSAPKESEARRVFRETLVQDVASAFVAPPQLSIPILANVALEVGTPPKAFDAGRWVAGVGGFTLPRDGRGADLRVLQESAAPAIQQQLAAAVRARDSARAFFPLPPELGFDTLQIVLRTGSKPEPGTASVPGRAT